MRGTIKIFFLITLILSCGDGSKKSPQTKMLDFGKFTILTPLNWNPIKGRGIDSYVGGILIGSTDTLNFDLGFYSNTLSEREPDLLFREELKNLGPNWDTTKFIIINYRDEIDLDKYKTYNLAWDTIDQRLAKILFPIRSGKGTTGVYIDSVGINPSVGRIRFNLYGTDLNEKNEKDLLNAIRTIKFK